MKTYSCGCVNDLDPSTGALFCVNKCQAHLDWLAHEMPKNRAYYDGLGIQAGGIPRCRRAIDELTNGLNHPGCLDRSWREDDGRRPQALEIGCGCSMYAPWIRSMGYEYLGIDTCAWACYWTQSTHYVLTTQVDITQVPFGPEIGYHGGEDGPRWDLILAAHTLEHLKDAPGELKRWVTGLRENGHVVIIVPDDTDQTNPDHQWFFSEASLCRAMNLAGLVEVRVKMQCIVEHENFLYAIGKKGPSLAS